MINLILGWILDLMLGDPARLPHPVVWMGRWIAWWERRLNSGHWRRTKGAVLAVGSIALTWWVGSLLPSWIGWLVVFFCLAGTTLRREVRNVFLALDSSLEEGRTQVARIVGRDTSELTAQEVRTAALETLAENLSDGVIAPLFWYAVGGVPAMLAYKMINTLDSMIGYHSERYLRFGTWAARIDDLANFIPARLTALLIIVCAPPRGLWGRVRFVIRYGSHHASPNSGWPEAALASVLNCRFGGAHTYFGEVFFKPHIGHLARPLTTHDMRISLRLALCAEVLAVLLTAVFA